MRTSAADELGDELADWMKEAVLPLAPIGARLSLVEDALEQEGWEVLLTLPKPSGATWDRQSVTETTRAVARFVDERAGALDLSMPAPTLVKITADEADLEDIAEEDAPEDGESSRAKAS